MLFQINSMWQLLGWVLVFAGLVILNEIERRTKLGGYGIFVGVLAILTDVYKRQLKDNSAIGTIINMVIGIAIGAAITCFLIVPGVRREIQNQAKAEVLDANKMCIRDRSVIVLILFLKDIRPTLVIACSIPLSVIFAVVLMYFSNISLNIISLSGLALGIGMLVDNSIVGIENIYRLRSEGYSDVYKRQISICTVRTMVWRVRCQLYCSSSPVY